jgi:hypothetical protein
MPDRRPTAAGKGQPAGRSLRAADTSTIIHAIGSPEVDNPRVLTLD